MIGKAIANSNPQYSINLPGYMIHSAIHAARPDIGCVLHIHTNAEIAVSSNARGLLTQSQTAMRWGRIACHEFEGVVVVLPSRRQS